MSRLEAISRLSATKDLEKDFKSLVSVGGRLVGSASEAEACKLLQNRLASVDQARITEHRFNYKSWASLECSLELVDSDTDLRGYPLYWSAETSPEGLEADLVDVGRGTQDDFHGSAHRIAGKVVLVRHEYPFSSNTVHRRLKYNWSREYGAAGFIIANNLPGQLLVTGSCGQDSTTNIPGIGVTRETGEMLAARPLTRVRMHHRNVRRPAVGKNLIAEIPGEGQEWVVVCAHYDGHDLAESALDNATGVASALSILRVFGPFVPRLARGLRIILFTAEESGLLGSSLYVGSLSETERRRIGVVVNLDTIVGGRRIACLTSGFEELGDFVRMTAISTGLALPCIVPLLRNSDHFNFAQHGIPAMRLVAGFDEPDAKARYLLTEGDRRDKVTASELRQGALAAGELIWAALTWPNRIAAHKPAGCSPP